jgi:hypothetical protein
MDRGGIEAAIRSAFAGVRLGSGVSLRQAQAIDATIFGIESPNYGALPLDEVTEDWTQVPDEELLGDCIAHMDAEGLRYYLPALMFWLLDHYEDEDRLFVEGHDMTAIGTISALAPSREFAHSYEAIYDQSFTDEQRRAIALYLEGLPAIVHLEHQDDASVTRALGRYWSGFLRR